MDYVLLMGGKLASYIIYKLSILYILLHTLILIFNHDTCETSSDAKRTRSEIHIWKYYLGCNHIHLPRNEGNEDFSLKPIGFCCT